MALRKGDKANFETLKTAFAHGRVALVESRLASTGEYCALVCAMSNIEGSTDLRPVPVAVMVWDNPYELFVDPTQDTLPPATPPTLPGQGKTGTVPIEGEMIALEAIIDRVGLYETMVALDVICGDKGAHIRANGGPDDKRLARRWDDAANVLRDAAGDGRITLVSP